MPTSFLFCNSLDGKKCTLLTFRNEPKWTDLHWWNTFRIYVKLFPPFGGSINQPFLSEMSLQTSDMIYIIKLNLLMVIITVSSTHMSVIEAAFKH